MTSARATLLRFLIQNGPTPIAKLPVQWRCIRPAVNDGDIRICDGGRSVELTDAGKRSLSRRSAWPGDTRPLWRRALEPRGQA